MNLGKERSFLTVLMPETEIIPSKFESKIVIKTVIQKQKWNILTILAKVKLFRKMDLDNLLVTSLKKKVLKIL